MYGSYSKSLHAWSQSRIIENTHTENGKGGRGFDSGSESSSPSLLPRLCPDNTASLYPDIKTSPGLLLERKVPPLPPRVTITSTNFHAEQLRQLSMQDSKRPMRTGWDGWYLLGAGTVILHQAEAGQIFLRGRIFLLNTDAEARVKTFSLLSSIINAARKMLGLWGCLPPPPSSTLGGFSG